MKFPKFYFHWLQKGNPSGTVDRFPELKAEFETSVSGIYCVGDLTGIPLIKLAAESGHELIERLRADELFEEQRKQNPASGTYDFIIVGGGPSGIAAALRAQKSGYHFLVIESSRMFNSIINFPKSKPIYVTPQDPPMRSHLKFSDGTKESLLEELDSVAGNAKLPIHEGEMVQQIIRTGNTFTVKTSKAQYKALRVIVAIGKTGNARTLNVPGERLPKVFTRLIDPGDHNNQDILVVGGGDSAAEGAAALAKSGNRVTLSYRRAGLSRPKEHNVAAFNDMVAQNKIVPIFESSVKEVRENEVALKTKDGEQVLPNHAVYALIGTEIPIQFFERSNVRMEGQKDAAWYSYLITMLSFFVMLYFGKSGIGFDFFGGTSSLIEKITAYLIMPLQVSTSWSLKGYAWYPSLNFYLGWLGSFVFLGSVPFSLYFMLQNSRSYFSSAWGKVKYGYILISAAFFTCVYFAGLLGKNVAWAEEPTYWYAFLYSTTILVFGIRRMVVMPTKYILCQTAVLIFIQVFFLFLLPFHFYEPLIAGNFPADGYLIREIFPDGKWSAFGLILFWPLNINNFGTSTFWTWFPFVQTFGILFYIVQRWGKGSYCGWICSCGAMAETFGDEYRTKAPHGPTAKKMENMGQIVLWAAFIATALHYAGQHFFKTPSVLADTVWGAYKLSIDVFFAGVLGLGVYFFMGGRVWCRFGCPLAALMHIYTRFSPYRIMSNKKRCISCNICTRACHMGIDVMSFASKGVPMNDVECVRCSACIVNCPLQVLTFGNLDRIDPDNEEYKKGYIPLKHGWGTGLKQKDIEMLLEDEKKLLQNETGHD